MAESPNAPLTAAEAQLRNELLAKGIDLQNLTNAAFRELVKLTKDHQDRLRAINVELSDSAAEYDKIASIAEKLQRSLRDISGKGKEYAQAVKDQKQNTAGSLSIAKQLQRAAEQLTFQKAELLRGELASKDLAGDTAVNLTRQVILAREAKKLENEKNKIKKEAATEQSIRFEEEGLRLEAERNRLIQARQDSSQAELANEAIIARLQEDRNRIQNTLAEKQLEYQRAVNELEDDRYGVKTGILTKLEDENASLSQQLRTIDATVRANRENKATIEESLSTQIAGIEAAIEANNRNIAAAVDYTTEQAAQLEVIDAAIAANRENSAEIEKMVQAYDELGKQVRKVEALTGIPGKLLQGLGKIPVIGDVLDIRGAQKAMNLVAQAGGTGFEVMGAGVRALGPSLKAALGPLGIVLLAAKAIQSIVQAMGEADKQVTDIARNLGVVKEDATSIRDRFFDLTQQTKSLGGVLENQVLLQKEIAESAIKIAEITGTTVDLTKDLGEAGEKLLMQFAAQTKFLKLSEEEQKGLLALNAQTGAEIVKIRENIFATSRLYRLQSGYQVNERRIFGEILKTSNLLKLSIKGGTDALIQATLQAQRFGGTLAESNKIASGFLDFESSIQREMEAEVLLGRDLNYEKIRYAALTRDQVTVNEELNRIIAEAGPDIKNNAIAFQALAESANMSEEQLGDYITKQKESEKLRVSAAKLTDREFEALAARTNLSIEVRRSLQSQIQQGQLSGAQLYRILQDAGLSAEAMTKIFDEQAMSSYGAQTAQEKFNDSLEAAKDTFRRFVDGGFLDMFANAIIDFSKFITKYFGGSEGTRRENIREAGEIEKTAKKELGAAGKDTAIYDQAYQQALEEQQSFGNILLAQLKYTALNPSSIIGANVPSVQAERVADITSYLQGSAAEEAASKVRGMARSGFTETPDLTKVIEGRTDKYLQEKAAETTPGKVKSLAEGGFAKTSGIAKIDEGEAVLGASTREVFIRTANTVERQDKGMTAQLGEMKKYYEQLIQVQQQQISLLTSIRDKKMIVQTDKLAYQTSIATATSYGNLQNSNIYLD